MPKRATAPANRREVIKLGVALPLGALAALPVLGGPRTARAQKMPKAQAQYQDQPKNGQKCATCQFFVKGENACQVVDGEIAPNAWCALYAPAG